MTPPIFTVGCHVLIETNNHQIYGYVVKINQVLKIVDVITTIESTTMKDINFNKLKFIPFGSIVGEFITRSISTKQPLTKISVPVNSPTTSTISLSYADILRKSLIGRYPKIIFICPASDTK